MSENDNVGVNQDSVDESEGRANKDSLSRRNFLKKSALVSAPIIMTINATTLIPIPSVPLTVAPSTPPIIPIAYKTYPEIFRLFLLPPSNVL